MQQDINQGSGYIFEVLEDTAVSFRRGDMDNPDSQKALLLFLGIYFQAEFPDNTVERILAGVSREWAYIAVRVTGEESARLQVAKAEREPGRNSGKILSSRVSNPKGSIRRATF